MPRIGLDSLEALIEADERALTGVYCIRNRVNDKRYIGSASVRLLDRIRQHRNALNAGKHPNRHLQGAWNKYGSRAFVFSVLKWCTPDRCIELEQEYIDTYWSWDRRYGYNLSPAAFSTLGVVCSKETKAKIAKSKTGRKLSDETRRKMSLKRKGVKHSAKHQSAVNAALRRPEVKAKISMGLKKRLGTWQES